MTRQLAASDSQSIRSRRLAMAMAGLALVLGLLFTGAGVFLVNNTFQSQAREHFDRLADRVQTDVQDRLNAPLRGLRGAAGVYAASNSVERAEFRAYVQFSELGRDFPGVRGFGFMARVLREDLDRFVAAERADEEPAFAVTAMPGTSTTSNAPDLYVVKFMEPQARNQSALGLDVGADPVRREAIERAVATGEPTLTRKTTLVQDQQQSPGWVYLLPVYRTGGGPQHANATPGAPDRGAVCTHAGQRGVAGGGRGHPGAGGVRAF